MEVYINKSPKALFGAYFFLPFLLNACASWSLDPLTVEGAERVYVPIFQNDTFYRRLEHDLTRQVIARIQEKPGLYFADEKSADVIIKGRIMDYQLRVLTEDRYDRVTDAAATITVEIQIVRARDDKVLKTKIMRDSESFSDLLNESLETAQAGSFFTLSRRILDLLEEGF